MKKFPDNDAFKKINKLVFEFSETCRSAKAEDLLLKDLTTVPTQGLYSNQQQSAYQDIDLEIRYFLPYFEKFFDLLYLYYIYNFYSSIFAFYEILVPIHITMLKHGIFLGTLL